MVLEYFICKGGTPLKSLEITTQTFIFAARSDAFFINETLPPLIEISKKGGSEIALILDTKDPTGVLGSILKQSDLIDISKTIENLQNASWFNFYKTTYNSKSIQSKNRMQFNFPHKETHCFRGYPIYGSLRQFIDAESKYILHLDCDMIFYEDVNFSWIKEGIKIMDENEDILCVLPKGGPPTKDRSLNQGTTSYQVDENRKLYLFKNFTSRHYLIHRERFLSLLPLKPLWLSWLNQLKADCGETDKCYAGKQWWNMH